LSPWIAIYFLAFAVSAGLSALLTAAARSLGVRYELFDVPQGRKAHARPIAITGGWGVFATFTLVAGGGTLFGPALADRLAFLPDPLPRYLSNLEGVRPQAFAMLLGATWIFAVGAMDDLRPLGWRFKLFAQFAAVAPLIWAGVRIQLFLPYPLVGALITACWFVLLMNSFNFIDNMDGLCATVAGTITLVLAVAAFQGGQLWLPALFLCLAGTLFGFLFFNFNPASIFLGDAGSLLTGYLLASFSILTTFYQPGQHQSGLPVLIPLAVMGVPLFDTASVMLIRWRNGKPLWVGDQNHFSHRLRDLGLSVRATAVTIGILTGAVGLMALPLRYLPPAGAALHMAAIAMLFGVIGAIEFAGRKQRRN
jgi:UDP-GlcNAc:undecaprenyl-phosphate/decaprenyl-phosphate GlcNAc-1-phosphate transferase